MDTIVTPVTVITLDSTKIAHSIKADLVARYFPPVVRLVQYDQSLPVIAVSLMQNGQAYTLPSGAAANIRVHKPDATYVYNPALGCDSTRKIVYFEVTQAMAAANGDGLAIIEIVVNGDIAGTSLITLHFEENPVPEDAIESSDEWETIYELGERIIASTVTPVSTAAGMTDHNVVYLYTGTESGWNQGHMYYYNGTTWVDAGIAVTDTTLSVAGLAADAKKTGDEIADLKDGLSDLETQIIATLVTDTASGAIASFPDGADNVPVKTLTVDIEPVQDLHGQANPYPAGGGVNVWDEVWELGAVLNSDGQNGDSFTDRIRSKNYIAVTPNTQYYVYSGTQAVMYKRFYDANKNYLGSAYSLDTSMNSAFTTPENAYFMRFNLAPAYGTTYKNDISINNPSTDHNYHPYSNICPISGHASAVVTRCGKNLATKTIHGYVRVSDKKVLIDNNSESVVFYAESGKTYTVSSSATMGRSILGLASTDEITSGFQLDNAIELIGSVNTWTATWTGWTVWYKCPNAQSTFANSVQVEQGSTATAYEPYNGQTVTIDLDGTRYGGTLNVETGVLTVTDANIASYNGETLPSTWISDRDVYASGTTPTTGAQVVYKLATPTTVQLTAEEVTTLKGQNNIWSDTGDTEVEYRADTKLYIQKVLNG